MDAHAHLVGLGWQGHGYSLGRHNNGIKKPILVSHKSNVLGLGAKEKKEKQADQWWLNAFDNALQDLGSGKDTSLSHVQKAGTVKGGLYGFFVRGDVLASTFSTNSSSSASPEKVHDVDIVDAPNDGVPVSQNDGTVVGANVKHSKRLEKKRKRDDGEQVKQYEQETEEQKSKRLKEDASNEQLREIHIAIPQPGIAAECDAQSMKTKERKKGKKKQHIPARVQRASLREGHVAEAELCAAEGKCAVVEAGTWDFEEEERQNRGKAFEMHVKSEISRRERAGEFGPVLPPFHVIKKMEKDALSRGEPFLHPSRLGIQVPPDQPVKKMNYKRLIYETERRKREARKEVKARLRQEMSGDGYIPLIGVTQEERNTVINIQKSTQKDKKREKQAAQESKARIRREMKGENKKTKRVKSRPANNMGEEHSRSKGNDPDNDLTVNLGTTSVSRTPAGNHEAELEIPRKKQSVKRGRRELEDVDSSLNAHIDEPVKPVNDEIPSKGLPPKISETVEQKRTSTGEKPRKKSKKERLPNLKPAASSNPPEVVSSATATPPESSMHPARAAMIARTSAEDITTATSRRVRGLTTAEHEAPGAQSHERGRAEAATDQPPRKPTRSRADRRKRAAKFRGKRARGRK